MSSPPLGPDASRPPSGILTPVSEGSLNRGYGTKRTGAAPMDDLLKPLIAVKVGAPRFPPSPLPPPNNMTTGGSWLTCPQPYPPKLYVQPRVLLPLMLLPREHLSLACIDPTAPDHQPRSRFYESHVKILDLESRLGSAPSVLLARNELTGTVCALERQCNGLYVVCQLGPWVDLSSLAAKATAVCHQRLRPPNPDSSRAPDAGGTLTTPQIHKEQKKKRAAIEAIQSLVRKRVRSASVPAPEDAAGRDGVAGPDAAPDRETLPATKTEEQTEPELAPAAGPAHDQDVMTPQDTADSIFNNIRAQYLDALYRSLVRVVSWTRRAPSLMAPRDRWRTLPKDLWRVLGLRSTSISSLIWTWPTL